MIKPFTPAEAHEKRCAAMPEEVISAFNKLLVNKFDGTTAIILQDEAIAAIINAYYDLNKAIGREQIFSERMLDIEDIYENYGWAVHFDKPAYNETYDAFWRFSKKPF